MVQTPRLEEEWDNHASDYSLDWLVQMESRRRVVHAAEEPETGIHGALRKLVVTPEVLTIMLKDCHLLEAALAADRVVAFKDEKAYAHFYRASASIKTKRQIGRRPHREHPDF